jgi:hypothetical protein
MPGLYFIWDLNAFIFIIRGLFQHSIQPSTQHMIQLLTQHPRQSSTKSIWQILSEVERPKPQTDPFFL